MQIIDLDPNNENAIQQVAAMLVERFQEHWLDMESALEALRESFTILEILSYV
jgi:hypothetical protein